MRASLRSIAAVLAATMLGTSLSITLARADRPDSGQGDPPPTPTPTPTAPPAPTPTPTTPPVVIAPTVNAGSTVVVNAPPGTPPASGGDPNVVVPGSVPIVIRNPVATEHRLLTVDGTILGSCNGNCTFKVPPGSYYLESADTEEYRSGKKKIVVTGPTLVDVSPGSKSQRTTGLIVGSLGVPLFFIGFFGTVFTAAHNSDVDSDCRIFDECDGQKTSVWPYVAMLVAGVAATTTGFIMFGTSSTKMKASGYAPASVGVAPLKNGMALTVSF
jgi:hypothetical protein